jgi:hypothetical protein
MDGSAGIEAQVTPGEPVIEAEAIETQEEE